MSRQTEPFNVTLQIPPHNEYPPAVPYVNNGTIYVDSPNVAKPLEVTTPNCAQILKMLMN